MADAGAKPQASLPAKRGRSSNDVLLALEMSIALSSRLDKLTREVQSIKKASEVIAEILQNIDSTKEDENVVM